MQILQEPKEPVNLFGDFQKDIDRLQKRIDELKNLIK